MYSYKRNFRITTVALFGLLLITSVLFFSVLLSYNEDVKLLKEITQNNSIYTPYVVNCITSAILIIVSLVGIIAAFKESEISVIRVILGLFVIFAGIGFATGSFKSIADTPKELASLIPSEVKAAAAFEIIAIIFGLAIVVTNNIYQTIINDAFIAIGFFSVLVVMCVWLDQYSGSESKITASFVFFLLSSLAGIGYSGYLYYFEKIKSQYAHRRAAAKRVQENKAQTVIENHSNVNLNKGVSLSKSAPVTQSRPAIDPQRELEKLKSLFDKGILTQEEYETKRQKYIDML